MSKRCWKVLLPGRAPFSMILMDDHEDALSKRFPELNGEYPVVDVLAPGESARVDGVPLVNDQGGFGYNLGCRAVGHSGWWCESALRKRHQPGEYSWQDLKTILQLPVSRKELARLDREVA